MHHALGTAHLSPHDSSPGKCKKNTTQYRARVARMKKDEEGIVSRKGI